MNGIYGIPRGSQDYFTLFLQAENFSPADGTTYFIGGRWGFTTATTNPGIQKIPAPCDLTVLNVNFTWRSVASPTSEPVTMNLQTYIRPETLEHTTLITNDLDLARPTAAGFSRNYPVNIDVNEGKGIMIQMVCPTWVTNPTSMELLCQLFCIRRWS